MAFGAMSGMLGGALYGIGVAFFTGAAVTAPATGTVGATAGAVIGAVLGYVCGVALALATWVGGRVHASVVPRRCFPSVVLAVVGALAAAFVAAVPGSFPGIIPVAALALVAGVVGACRVAQRYVAL
jgi:hypothetical protein